MAYKLTKEIACPRCGEAENLSLGGGEIYESFFDGSIGEGCVCDECGQEFTVCLRLRDRLGRGGAMPLIMRCRECGWTGTDRELLHRDVREEHGDVCCRVCPGCHRTDFEGRRLFVKVEGEPCR